MKSIFVLPLASIALFALSAAAVKQGCCYGMNPAKFNSVPLCRRYADVRVANENALLRNKLSKVNVDEGAKETLWKIWFNGRKKPIEKDVENVAYECSQKCESDWDEFMKSVEQKWMHFNPDMEKEYKCSVYPQALKWGVTKWIAWFHETALTCLKQDFKNWITKCGKEYHQTMRQKLNVWHKKYLDEWCKQDWKVREDRYFKKWIKMGLRGDPDYWVKLSQCNRWAARVKKEHKEWTDNLKAIENNCNDWVNWKKEKMEFYKQWLQAFTKQWITEEQWKTWTEERKQYILTKKPDTQKSATKKTATKKTTTKKTTTKKAAEKKTATKKAAAPK
ncbi:tryptophan-rich protein [Plasmodium vivax]|nr:tryptophan-rich protein [Plasmodium vivax]